MVKRWCGVNFQCQGVLLIWIIGQRPITLALGAGGDCLDIFLSLIISLLSLTFWETARYILKYGLKGPLNPKQPTSQCSSPNYMQNCIVTDQFKYQNDSIGILIC